jgi:flavin-binding protein dodecin
VSTDTLLKHLFELRAVLDRIGESDTSLHEAVAQDIERASDLTDACIAEVSGEAEGEGAA